MATVDVCIPVYKPGTEFDKLMMRISRQTIRPHRIIIINTEETYWREEALKWPQREGISVIIRHISKEQYDHGRTRDEMASLSDADFLLFMTMDAYPYDNMLIENMVSAFDDESIAACYGRQLPKPGCAELERQTRMFNYPATPIVKSGEDVEKLGIKTYFCSNVCAMYRREIYEGLGGFPERTIFNEDMIFAKKVIDNGYKIAYTPKAMVFHSHNYSCSQYFRRSFDMAVSQADNPQVFSGVSSEKEGVKLVRSVVKRLVKQGKVFQIIPFGLSCAAKYAGYFLGKRYTHLPGKLIDMCTDNKNFWRNS